MDNAELIILNSQFSIINYKQPKGRRGEKASLHDRQRSLGQLVALGLGVTTFTPVPYQRHRL